MNIYAFLARLPFLRRYSLKFLFVAFLGIHIPLLGIISFILLRDEGWLTPGSIFVTTLVLTLLATGITLLILNQLLAPLTLTKSALEAYLSHKTLPDLPLNFTDEAGILMRKVQFTVTSLNDLLDAKRDMVSLLSHDMRTPLGQMVLTAELIKSEKVDASVAEYARWIIESGRKQLDLLEYVLKMLQQGDLEITPADLEPVLLGDVLRENLMNFGDVLQTKRLRVVPDFPEQFSLRVKKDLFSQVIQNLLQNSFKFSQPGGEIRVSARAAEGQCLVEIIDQGLGFEPKQTENLFERFTKLGREGTAGERSTGMGLYLSRKIVERHQGTLQACSEGVNRGATFRITLPHPVA